MNEELEERKMSIGESWRKKRELGAGGQGKVWLAQKKVRATEGEHERCNNFAANLQSVRAGRPTTGERYPEAIIIQDFIVDIAKESHTYGAWKELHNAAEARDAALAKERMEREIAAMQQADHPSLLKIHEVDSPTAYVSEYHPKGVLSSSLTKFEGRPLDALRAIRPLVEGVGTLHADGTVHRDIKTENVFIADDDRLVLGDFGLVHFDDDKTRLSETFENVGSRDWMPGWAQGMKLEDVRPNFDVFALGKIIWSMISGVRKLPLWYYYKPQHDLEQLFPNNSAMPQINQLLSSCIVEEPEDCLADASALLKEVDDAISALEVNATVLRKDGERRCLVCGKGSYQIIADRNNTHLRNFGIDPAGMQSFRVFSCGNCGHVQLFSMRAEGDLPNGWVD